MLVCKAVQKIVLYLVIIFLSASYIRKFIGLWKYAKRMKLLNLVNFFWSVLFRKKADLTKSSLPMYFVMYFSYMIMLIKLLDQIDKIMFQWLNKTTNNSIVYSGN